MRIQAFLNTRGGVAANISQVRILDYLTKLIPSIGLRRNVRRIITRILLSRLNCALMERVGRWEGEQKLCTR